MPDDLAAHEARLVGDEDVSAPVAQHLPFAFHGGKAPVEAFALFLADREALAQRFLGDRHAGLHEYFEDLLRGRGFPSEIGPGLWFC